MKKSTWYFILVITILMILYSIMVLVDLSIDEKYMIYDSQNCNELYFIDKYVTTYNILIFILMIIQVYFLIVTKENLK